MNSKTNSHAINDNTVPVTADRARVTARASLAAAFALGASLVFLVGFAHSQTLHDVAHDTRHSNGFPCH